MPDIKTALKEALQRKANQMHQTPPATTAAVKQIIAQWDDTEPTMTKEKEMPYEPPAAQKFTAIQAPAAAMPVNHTVFNYLRDKGGATRAEVLMVMAQQGFKTATVSTLLSQLVVAGQASNMGGIYKVIVPEYRPYNIKKARMANKAAAKKIAKAAGIAALPPQATPKKQPVLTAAPATAMLDDDIDLILKRLSVFQAIALYKKLKVMLGEAV
jgi:hypothetical protein